MGASGSSPGPGAPGSVWLFKRDSSGWTPTLVAKSGESFGTKVAADGERILILAPGPAFEQHAWMAGPDLAGWRIWPVLADIPTYDESASDADLDAGTAAIGVTRGWDTPGYVLVFRW